MRKKNRGQQRIGGAKKNERVPLLSATPPCLLQKIKISLLSLLSLQTKLTMCASRAPKKHTRMTSTMVRKACEVFFEEMEERERENR
jgi:hypothetical protein